jgi:hypothetical protein
MEVQSAFEALGLAGPVPPAALKRAYLKAVRKHPPERDPDGFRRVRDAYEWLDAHSWLWTAPEREESLAEAAPLQVEAALEPEAESPPDAPPTAESTSEPEPDPLDLDFDALVEPIDPQGLVKLGNGVLLALGPARSLDAYPPPPYLVIDLVLRLIEHHEAELASDLVDAFQEALDGQRYPLRALAGETIGTWQLIREVEDLRDEVPDQLRQKLASGIREGEFGPAVTAFERASAQRGPELRVTLEREAPTLYAALWPRVDREAAGFDPKPNQFRFVFGWRWLWLILILARCAFSNSDRPARSTHLAPPPTIVAPPPPVVAASPTSEPRPGEPWLAEGGVADRQRERVERVIDEAIERHDCTSLIEQWPLYRASFALLEETQELIASRETKRRAAHAACPELVTTLE